MKAFFAFIAAAAVVGVHGAALKRANVPLGNASSYLITSLPQEGIDIKRSLRGQYSGYIPTSHTTSNQLVIWLNGGPGCSSLFGSFGENGPVHVEDDGSLKANPYSWHRLANMLYVEQPAGTGFSFTTAPAEAMNELQIAADFYIFLNGFYEAFPETKSYELFITGESYAGFYIPYISAELLAKKSLTDGTPINFAGVAIGNGLISRVQQGGGTVEALINDRDFFWDSGLLDKNTTDLALMNNVIAECSKMPVDDWCDMYNVTTTILLEKTPDICIDAYNVKHDCADLDKKEHNLSIYLNTPAVRQALHVTPEIIQATGDDTAWGLCSNAVGIRVTKGDYGQKIPFTETVIPKLVEAGLPVYLINGDLDYVLHYVAYERAIGNMTWNGETGFGPAAPLQPWKVNGSQLGLRTHARGLTYYRAFESGHMIPLDQPASAFHILRDLLTKRS
ncbi:hypothetical protein HK101_002942 [Irineochytrium annulatum]|nr:hypothetical protein HK101_002942 [Irineochytrium annulatum]